MIWKIEFQRTATRDLNKLDHQVQRRIHTYLTKLAELPDPHLRGKGLIGNRAGLWRYRVGDYRVICQFESEVLVILVVEVGHRSSIYE